MNLVSVIVFVFSACAVLKCVKSTFATDIGNMEMEVDSAIAEQTLFKEVYPVALQECARMCLRRPKICRSFNYISRVQICQLSASSDRDLVKPTLYTTYSSISTWSKSLAGICASSNCSAGYYCDEKDRTRCKRSECEYAQIDGYRRQQFETSIGTFVEYECTSIITRPSGSMISYCQENGQWANIAGFCEIYRCYEPPNEDNSFVGQGSNLVGAVRSYHCRTGYYMIGSDSVTCQDTGEWTKRNFTCPKDPCGAGYTYLKNLDLCYKVTSIHHKSPSEFKEECWYTSGDLVTIKSKEIQDIFDEIVQEDYGLASYIIDAEYSIQDKLWLDRKGFVLNYTRWGNGTNDDVSKRCAGIFNKYWYRVSCEAPVQTRAVCIQGLKCLKHFVYLYPLNKCYMVSNYKYPQNKQDAETGCINNQASLMAIDSPEKETVFRKAYYISSDKKMYTVLNPYEKDYQLVEIKGTKIVVNIQGCPNARIRLLPSTNQTMKTFYEILFVNQSYMVLNKMKYGKLVNSIEYHHLSGCLVCCSYQKYRITLSPNIEVADEDKKQLLSMEDQEYHVTYIGFGGDNATYVVDIGRQYWIDGVFRSGNWSFSTGVPMNYTNWADEKTNGTSSTGIVIYMNYWSRESFWTVRNITDTYTYVCVKDAQ